MSDSIRRYYSEDIVNLHNRDSSRSSVLNSRIDHLRSLVAGRFSWDGKIVFFPNPYYAKRTVFENFRGRRMFANEVDPDTMESFSFSRISSPKEITSPEESFVFWRGNSNGEDFGKGSFVLREMDWNSGCSVEADAFVSSPMEGVTVLGFRDGLVPFYLGSNSLVKLDRNSFELNSEASGFECGTGNYALLLFLADQMDKEY